MTNNTANGVKPLQRANEAEELLTAVQKLVTSFIRTADEAAPSSHATPKSKPTTNGTSPHPTLLEQHSPSDIQSLFNFTLPQTPLDRPAFLAQIEKIQHYSVNTWSQGFLDKLYASPQPVGIASDLLLSSLNTNVHTYQVSPALTVIEKTTTCQLASLFGLNGEFAGGVSQPGGSAANQTSLVIARNTLYPETKSEGLGGRKFVLFTSEHGHYSVEKAAQICGFGSSSVRSVPVDDQGRMRPAALESAILTSKASGETPFYVNATAGTTVLGSFDPLASIASICSQHNLWFHVDASWGGGVAFSNTQRHKLTGIELADSITWCAHKMLNVPVTCSFLLGADIRKFHQAMTLPASYLFHNNSENEVWDLADLTPQCGRRGDSLKLALTWLYYGSDGLGAYIDSAFRVAQHLCSLIHYHPRMKLVSSNPPPCLQVCFYLDKQAEAKKNSATTERIVGALVARGFMTDFAEGKEGKFFRVVVNGQTRVETVEALVRAIEEVGDEVR